MLGVFLMISTTYLLTKIRNLEISVQTIANGKMIITLIIIATILFWLLHMLISKDKKFSRYEDNWQEGEFRIVRGIIIILESVLYLKMTMNIHENLFIFDNAYVIVLIVIMNIVQIALIDHIYSGSIREMIVDALLMQIQDARNTLFVVLAVLCALNLTTFGALIVVVVAGFILF